MKSLLHKWCGFSLICVSGFLRPRDRISRGPHSCFSLARPKNRHCPPPLLLPRFTGTPGYSPPGILHQLNHHRWTVHLPGCTSARKPFFRTIRLPGGKPASTKCWHINIGYEKDGSLIEVYFTWVPLRRN